MDNLSFIVTDHGPDDVRMPPPNNVIHYAHAPGIDFGGGRKGTTLVAWLPDGIIIRTRGAKVWNGIGMGNSASPASITYYRFVPREVGEYTDDGKRGPVLEVGRFDEIEEVEYGKHYAKELQALMERALTAYHKTLTTLEMPIPFRDKGVASSTFVKPGSKPKRARRDKTVGDGRGLCPSCGKRCKGFTMGLACTAKRSGGTSRRATKPPRELKNLMRL